MITGKTVWVEIPTHSYSGATQEQADQFAILDLVSSGQTYVNSLPADEYCIDTECTPCGVGYTLNPLNNLCEKINSMSATLNSGGLKTTISGSVSSAYNAGGAVFYENITSKPFPIQNNSTWSLSDSSGTPVITYRKSNSWIWKSTNSTNGRLNSVGVWGDGVGENEWVGFTQCIDIQEGGMFCIGISSDNESKLNLDGETIVMLDAYSGGGRYTNTFSYYYWHIFEIYLPAGKHIIEMYSLNRGSIASFGAEIYHATKEELSQITNQGVLEQKIIFSTENMLGKDMHLGENSGYSCPTGYALDNCDNINFYCTQLDRETPSNCGVFYNTEITSGFTRNNCGPGLSGSTVEVTIEAGVTSGKTQEIADNSAILLAQEQANMLGNCGITGNTRYVKLDAFSENFRLNDCNSSDRGVLNFKIYDSLGTLLGIGPMITVNCTLKWMCSEYKTMDITIPGNGSMYIPGDPYSGPLTSAVANSIISQNDPNYTYVLI